MKKEVLSVRNFNLKYSNAVNLKDLSLSLMEGESTALLGLASSGKDAFFQVVLGKEWSDSGIVKIDNRKIYSSEGISSCVHVITDLNYSITDWTVAEYIGLVTDSFVSLFHRKKILDDEIQDLFFSLDIDINAARKISNLTEIEKRIIDLVKAFRKKSRILMIADEFDGASTKEIVLFKQIMDRIIHGNMTVLVKAQSESVSSILADNYIIFKNGRIIKKCRKDFIRDEKQLEHFLLGESGIPETGFEVQDNVSTESGKKTVYKVKNIITGRRVQYSFSFNYGEVVTILALSIDKKEKVFNILSGREINRDTEIFLDNEKCSFTSLSDFVKKRIVSSVNLGTNSEFLDKMSVGENIIMPSLYKFSSLRYIFYGKKMADVLEDQLVKSGIFKRDFEEDETNRRIQIMLERWYVFKPGVLILLEPFLHCDVYGISIIKSYIRKFTDIGTAVIIVKAREKDIVDISDRIIKI